MNEPWRTTPTDLMSIFRDSLRSLVPSIERARLTWREGESYDEWDEIAGTLFDKLVLGTFAWSAQRDRMTAPFARYDMSYESYEALSFLQIEDLRRPSPNRLAFIRFGSQAEPFDVVRCHLVDLAGRRLHDGIESIPAGEASFSIAALSERGRETLTELSVEG